MLSKLRKIWRNKRGFTLTEVMIAMAILSVAIVSTSNLLVGLISSNRNNVATLQAYYLAQEGLEAIRNIRDTNWLHNVPWNGDGELYPVLTENRSYFVDLTGNGWTVPVGADVANREALRINSGWDILEVNSYDEATSDPFIPAFHLDEKITDETVGSESYRLGQISADFYRHINILPYDGDECGGTEDDCANFVLVQSVVNWKDGSKEGELKLETILSNWKGGAL